MGPYTEQILERYSVSQLTQLFEIKRPPKSVSSTVSRMNSSPPQDNTDVSTERIFIRNNRGRSSCRKNKYRREFSEEVKPITENELETICRKFRLSVTDNNSSRDDSKASITPKLLRSRSDNQTDSITPKSKTDLDELRQQYRTDGVKRRNLYKKKNKEVLEEKIKSFVDAVNDEETEECRKNLIREMDKHIADMNKDGFLDGTEDDKRGTATEDQDCDLYSPDESVFLNMMGTRNSDDSLGTSTISDDFLGASRKSDDTQHTLVYEEFDNGVHQSGKCEANVSQCEATVYQREETESKTNASRGVLNEVYTSSYLFKNNSSKEEKPPNYNSDATEGMFIKVDVVTSNSSRLNDEFTESLSDDLESGLSIFEAFNDDGRELIEVQVIIDRREVFGSLTTMPEEIKKDIEQSDMVFFQDSDSNQIRECEDGLVGERADEPMHESVSSNEGNSEQNIAVYAPDSNRSTIYSTTSRDSSVFDEDDEGIEVGRSKQENEYVNVRRETYCDDKGIVRIERIVHPENISDRNSFLSAIKRNDSASSPGRLEYIIAEIRSTERKYVEDLTKVVNNFRPYIKKRCPGDLNCLLGYLFANVKKIYRQQKNFLASIEESGDDINKIVNCFLQHESLFELYPTYFRNKPKADIILKEFSTIIQDMKEHFEERLDFSAYLLTPVQRLGKYILFLENIEKELTKLEKPIGCTQMALDIVKTEMSKGNDYVAIASIQNSPISNLDYGSFKMRENFTVIKPKKVELTVFLFTDIIVLTTVVPGNHETFNYYNSIRMEDLTIATFENLTIHLTDYTKGKRKSLSNRFTHVLVAKSEKIWNSWREAIESVLWQQMYKIKQMTLTSDTKPKLRDKKSKNRSKSLGSSIFYLD